MQTILIVDDESQIRSALDGVLTDEGYKTLLAGSGEECLELLRHKSPDVVLLDIWLPGNRRPGNARGAGEREDHPEVIMISGHGNIETAVRATKLGAFDFLEKPLSIERTLIVLKNAIEAKRLRSENLEYKKQFQVRSVIVGDSIPIKALRQQISLIMVGFIGISLMTAAMVGCNANNPSPVTPAGPTATYTQTPIGTPTMTATGTITPMVTATPQAVRTPVNLDPPLISRSWPFQPSPTRARPPFAEIWDCGRVLPPAPVIPIVWEAPRSSMTAAGSPRRPRAT